MNKVIKLGLTIAAIGILANLLTRYLIDLSMLFSFKFWVINIVINIIIIIVLGRKYLRDPEEGRLGYGQAVKNLFLALLISSVITTSFGIMFYSGDTEMEAAYEQYEIDAQETGAKLGAKIAGQSEAEQDAAVEKVREMRESGELQSQGYPFTWAKFPLTIGIGAIFNLIFSLLLALFVREKETQYA